jgi:hypothetical protein
MQINTKPQPSKPLIDASMPKNISAFDQKQLEDKWNEQARIRNEAIEKETKIPEIPSVKLTYQLRKFGRWWISYYKDEKGRFVPLLPAPSLGESAMDVLESKMSDDVVNS